MDSGVRKKRTLAERRESDKLRQRRFRAKKREEARVLNVIAGTVEKEKKERVYTVPKKTADEIRETNRIRQQRFRARRKGEYAPPEEMIQSVDAEDMNAEIQMSSIEEAQLEIPLLPENPMELVQRILLQAASEEKNRQTEIRREKDRIRKRRERQRKKDKAMKFAALTPEEIMKQRFQKKLEHLQKNMDHTQKNVSPNSLIEEDEEDIEDEEDNEDNLSHAEIKEEEVSDGEESSAEYFDASKFMEQLEEMGLVLGVVTPPDGSDGPPALEIKPKASVDTSEESTSSSPMTPAPSIQDIYSFTEKKPWQRCNSAEERRERERMRKRMYRAKQKYISTGKLEMRWDPAPIKRTPNDDSEEGITPLPDWNNSNMSSEQKLVAHRIYNKRYRERLKSSALKDESSRSESREPSIGEISLEHNEPVSPEIFQEIFSTISQCDLSSLLVQSNNDE